MKKSTHKQRLFEVMQKVNPDFHFINEMINLGDFYLTDEQVNEIMKGYLDAAIWTEEERLKEDYKENNPDFNNNDDDDEDEIDKLIRIKNNLNRKQFTSFLTEDIDVNSRIQAYVDIKNFVLTAGSDAIYEAIEETGESRLGMDIWLTRNHHGSGFFDHSYEYEQQLIDAAHKLKEVDLYLGDDNKLYFSNSN
jgi:hypothetical protein